MSGARAGLFVSFEGGEGAGKSTQARHLARGLEARGLSVVLVREPGGTPPGEAIRELLLDADRGPVVDRAELLLYLAARAELTERVLRPALSRGSVVIADRFADAAVAYQGGGRAIGLGDVRALNAFATGELMPDVTFLLDIDPAIGLARAAGRSRPDRIEREDLEFHERVRAAYRTLATEPRFVVLDGLEEAAALGRVVLAETLARLHRRV